MVVEPHSRMALKLDPLAENLKPELEPHEALGPGATSWSAAMPDSAAMAQTSPADAGPWRSSTSNGILLELSALKRHLGLECVLNTTYFWGPGGRRPLNGADFTARMAA